MANTQSKTRKTPRKGGELKTPILKLNAKQQEKFDWIRAVADPEFVGQKDSAFCCLVAIQLQMLEEQNASSELDRGLFGELRQCLNVLSLTPASSKNLALPENYKETGNVKEEKKKNFFKGVVGEA